jgi:hypothetical protein
MRSELLASRLQLSLLSARATPAQIDSYLLAHPTKMRPAADLADLDAKDVRACGCPVKLPAGTQNDGVTPNSLSRHLVCPASLPCPLQILSKPSAEGNPFKRLRRDYDDEEGDEEDDEDEDEDGSGDEDGSADEYDEDDTGDEEDAPYPYPTAHPREPSPPPPHTRTRTHPRTHAHAHTHTLTHAHTLLF